MNVDQLLQELSCLKTALLRVAMHHQTSTSTRLFVSSEALVSQAINQLEAVLQHVQQTTQAKPAGKKHFTLG